MAYNLFFELSSEDRAEILTLLQEGPLRLSELSKELDVLPQEISRQLVRLESELLVEKNVEGQYQITPYAEAALNLTNGFNFISRNKEYLTSHTVSFIPSEFILRLGELNCLSYVPDVMTAFHNVEKMIEGSNEYVYIISDQILMSTIPLLYKAEERGVEFRLILPKDVSPPSDFVLNARPQVDEMHVPEESFIRFIKKQGVGLCISEKEIGFLVFPNRSGRFDYLGFGGRDRESLNWCRDLFEACWRDSTSKIPEQILKNIK